MKLPRRGTYLSIFYFLFILSLLKKFLSDIANGFAKESWGVTEFLINYQGGFVRRGLIGEIIFQLYHSIDLNPYITILSLCVFCYLALVIFFVKFFLKNSYPVFILPFVVFLGNPIIHGFWLRKDNLIILIFILIISFATKKSKSNYYLFLVNIFFIIGLLSHETIGFFCFPILLLILINKNKIFYKTETTLLKPFFISVLQLLPSLFIFFCVLDYKGSPTIANIIWDSWKPIDFPIQHEYNKERPGEINTISLSLEYALRLTFSILSTFKKGIYGPLVWVFILLLIYYLLININKLNGVIIANNSSGKFNKTILSNILLFQLVSITPIFILAHDYGRWVFFWVTSSFAINLLISNKDLSILFPKCVDKISLKINHILDSILVNSKEFIFLLCIFISFPMTDWDLFYFVTSNSLFIVLQFTSGTAFEIFTFIKGLIL